MKPRLLPLTLAVMLPLLGVKTVSALRALAPALHLPRASLLREAAAATPNAAQAANKPDPAQAANKPDPAQAASKPEAAQAADKSMPPPAARPATQPAAPPAEAATSPLGQPPISDAERGVLLALRSREAALDARQSALADRQRLLDASAHRLDARLAQLDALQSKLQELDQERHQKDDANWAGLVKLYESMKPHDAAIIFDGLDMDVLLPVLDRMKEAKAALVLAAMDTDKARTATIRLAVSRHLMAPPASPSAPAGSGPG